MLFVFGIRVVRIANFIDTDYMCYRCRSFEREVNFYQSYFHFCLIPVFPVGQKKILVRCKNCGDETQTEALVEKYSKTVKTPLWFYSAIFLSILLAAAWLYWHQSAEKKHRKYIANPVKGDVYTIREEKNTGNSYYFLQVIDNRGDSILALSSNLEYGYPLDHLEADDFFVKSDTLHFAKKDLYEMLNNGEIYSINRDAGKE